jgi:SAM-dependent methyltransferase
MTASRPCADAYLYAFTIFVSAFLLFQVQPIIAKMILPWFGGTSAVWSTCMVFFQIVLLLGYLYAHWMHRMPGTLQATIHTILLALSLAVLPILPNPSWKPTDANNPSLLILGLLAVTIGLPYMILSATSPLLQSWYARRSGSVPYRLFALSNLASMLALLSYPVLIEPNLSVRTQSYVWSSMYAGFATACVAAAWLASRASFRKTASAQGAISTGEPPSWAVRALWIALAACASMLLLSVTTFLTQDVAAIPFLWVLPLSVYLLSFIICFESPRLYNRTVYFPFLLAALLCFAYFLRPRSIHIHMGPTITLLALALFICCMVCHGELARLKPHPSRLTGYYVMISAGGALGGLFVGLLAPNIFRAYYEFPIGLSLCAALTVLLLIRQGIRPLYRAALLAGLLGYVVTLGVITRNTVTGFRAVARNFYGELRVEDQGSDDDIDANRKLLHGRINHGIQMRDALYRRTPVAYFCESSGIGHVMHVRPAGTNWRVGILGLGAGALAAYGKPGDTFRIYEINPLVLRLAQSEFTYLKDTPAKIEIALGDGRLTLEREPAAQFDLLVMDAFSGDSVPVHLITREAFQTYFRHLKPGGMLALNISNRYLDLAPVMERAAAAFHKRALVFDYTPGDEDDFLCNASSWALLLDRNAALPESLKSGRVLQPRPEFRMWTDDFSNMFSILK